MDLQIVYRAGAFIRNTLKRALSWEDDPYYPKRLALEDRSSRLSSFMRLCENPVIKSFLRFDICYLLADNYLIAMTYIYLEKAEILLGENDVHYFFSALYLAHEMQEDSDTLRKRIVYWYPGSKMELKTAALHFVKNKIWFRINFKAHVTKQSCDKLMQLAPSWPIWQRRREESHSGAFRTFDFRLTKCQHCCKQYLHNPLICDSPDDNNNELYEEDQFETSDWEFETTSEYVLT